MLNVLRLQEVDIETLRVALQTKRDEAPQFFAQSPIVVDCSDLGDGYAEIDFFVLKELITELGFIPVGVRGIPENQFAALSKAGWAVMRAGHAPSTTTTSTTSTVADTNTDEQVSQQQSVDTQKNDPEIDEKTQTVEAVPTIQSLTIERPVRSGQQVYAANADMTVLSATSSGSELMADGSIHAYGPMRGRVLAGARGNESARIFCHSLQAELIAIAGRYLLLDESDTDLKGKPAMIRLEGEKLIIEPLG